MTALSKKLEKLNRLIQELNLKTTHPLSTTVAEHACKNVDNASKSIEEILDILQYPSKDKDRRGYQGVLSDRGLLEVATKLGHDWKLLATQLGLKNYELEQIERDHPCQSVQQNQIALIKWRQNQVTKNRSHSDILKSFKKKLHFIKRQDIIDGLEQMTFNSSQDTSIDELEEVKIPKRLENLTCGNPYKPVVFVEDTPKKFVIKEEPPDSDGNSDHSVDLLETPVRSCVKVEPGLNGGVSNADSDKTDDLEVGCGSKRTDQSNNSDGTDDLENFDQFTFDDYHPDDAEFIKCGTTEVDSRKKTPPTEHSSGAERVQAEDDEFFVDDFSDDMLMELDDAEKSFILETSGSDQSGQAEQVEEEDDSEHQPSDEKYLKTLKKYFGYSKFRPIMCEECGVYLSTKGSLKRHKIKHTEKTKHACDICDRKFPAKEYLDGHMSSKHGKAKQFQCAQCKKTFIYRKNLKYHTRNKVCSGKEKPGKYNCSDCEKSFPKMKGLGQHMSIHRLPSLSCHVCGKLFIWKSCLRNICRHVKNDIIITHNVSVFHVLSGNRIFFPRTFLSIIYIDVIETIDNSSKIVCAINLLFFMSNRSPITYMVRSALH